MADATGPGPYRTSRVGFFFIALSALLFGSLGVTTKGVLTVATTNAFSITLRRAIIALLLGERLQSSIVVALPGILRHQIGDEEVRVLYPAEKLPEVARVVGARKRRSLAPATARKRSGLSTVRASASRQDRV